MLEIQNENDILTLKPQEASPKEFLEKNFPGKVILGLKVGEQIYDLQSPLPEEGKAELVVAGTPESLELIRHSSAHVMAQAVKRLFPETQVTIGPVIENGFFYDFFRPEGFKDEDLKTIENEMKKIVKSKLPITREQWPKDKAVRYFSSIGEKYKCEIIEDLCVEQNTDVVGVYTQGEFTDLCRGPHVPHTGHIKALKLLKIAGAYWRGDENREMLTRIYGTAFDNRDNLKAYLHQLEEAKKRDHRRIGSDQKLFSFHPEAPASPFFHPRGAVLFDKVQDLLKALNAHFSFDDVLTPLILNDQLWKKSGHWDNYKENMYFTDIDEQNFAVKPMNCPGHCLIYAQDRRSYKELPIRVAEFGRVHRHERSGVLNGLFRVRSFVQDDAHVFCQEDQCENEIARILEMIRYFYAAFEFDFHLELSTRPEKRIGEDSLWDRSEGVLKKSLENVGLEFQLNPGDGAFYGPKIDFHLKDSIGRSHQCGTVQLDFSMPERFELKYTGSDNEEHRPVMIHRAIAGSLERFLGILIEHYAGKFPFWMSPVQIAILSVVDESAPYAQDIGKLLKEKGYRVHLDTSPANINSKIKAIRKLYIPYTVVLGPEETQKSCLSLRYRDASQKQGLGLEAFIKELEDEVDPIGGVREKLKGKG